MTDSWDEDEGDFLYQADENCNHEIVDASGGGVVCLHCPGWFCY